MIEERVLRNMTNYGGSFVRELAYMYRLADINNKEKLEECFKKYFEEYSKEIWNKHENSY